MHKAMASLFQAPLDQFVAVRKRLAGELKSSGETEAAELLSKYKRPTLSVWVINQLWWRERDLFEALFSSARPLSEGDLSAAREHRQVLAELRSAATRLLKEEGRTSSEATLRRAMTTLSALAAIGSFAPDRAGSLQNDRDPPGFESIRFANPPPPAQPQPTPAPQAETVSSAERARNLEQQQAERERQERARLQALRQRLQVSLEVARREANAARQSLEQLRSSLCAAEARFDETQNEVAKLEDELEALK